MDKIRLSPNCIWMIHYLAEQHCFGLKLNSISAPIITQSNKMEESNKMNWPLICWYQGQEQLYPY